GLRLFQAFEALAFEGRPLGMTNAGLDFSFPIGMANPASQAYGAVVRQNIAENRIERGIINVWGEHTLLQVIENHDSGATAQPTECFLVELGPGPCTGAERQEAHGLAAIAEGENKQSGASVLAGLRIADRRPATVVDLGFLSGCRDDHCAGNRCLHSPESAHEAFGGLVTAAKSGLGNQILPNSYGVTALAQPQLNRFPKGFASTGRPTTMAPAHRRWRNWLGRLRVGGHLIGCNGRFCCLRVGGHLVGRNGRFCPLLTPPTRRLDGNSRGLQVSTCRFTTHTKLLLNAS